MLACTFGRCPKFIHLFRSELHPVDWDCGGMAFPGVQVDLNSTRVVVTKSIEQMGSALLQCILVGCSSSAPPPQGQPVH